MQISHTICILLLSSLDLYRQTAVIEHYKLHDTRSRHISISLSQDLSVCANSPTQPDSVLCVLVSHSSWLKPILPSTSFQLLFKGSAPLIQASLEYTGASLSLSLSFFAPLDGEGRVRASELIFQHLPVDLLTLWVKVRADTLFNKSLPVLRSICPNPRHSLELRRRLIKCTVQKLRGE